ncbi:MAG TPA: hypothetical protein VNA69_11905 [Thermoanaerobaculia bacterium]|nr:hypothetical protein [Thermoanaerobaculia bacterium]
MWLDPIVEETRKARAEVVAPFGENIHEFFEYLRKREGQSDRAAVTLQPNTPEPTVPQAASR